MSMNQRHFNLIINFLWLALFIFACFTIYFAEFNGYQAVSLLYYQAGQDWQLARPLYSGLGLGFIYFPQSAILYTPLSFLPYPLAEVIWRILSLSVFVYGIYQFAKLATIANNKLVYVLMSIAVLPLTITLMENGQMHLLITGLMMLATVAISKSKWWTAAILLTLALAFKPTSLVLFLLFTVIFPKLWLRIIVCTLLAIGLPFLTQHPDYVFSQYQAFAANFMLISRIHGADPKHWAQLFGVLQQLNGYLPGFDWQLVIRLMAAFFVLALSVFCLKKYDRNQALIYIFTLAMGYLMLFNPRTENNDYVMIAPLMGYFLAEAIVEKKKAIVVFLVAALLLLFLNHSVAKLITPDSNTWLKPFVTIWFMVYVIAHALRRVQFKQNNVGQLAA